MAEDPEREQPIDVHARLPQEARVGRHASRSAPRSPLGSQLADAPQQRRRGRDEECFQPAVSQPDRSKHRVEREQPDAATESDERGEPIPGNASDDRHFPSASWWRTSATTAPSSERSKRYNALRGVASPLWPPAGKRLLVNLPRI